ncbi:LytR/AlgR family response regulator transcription factor [Runella sp.]|uniref:LytR/AlgR family response regulator transcription factor n=1 Tax=Runella sp. TaxID=1960881 RepID=UPI003D0A7B8D
MNILPFTLTPIHTVVLPEHGSETNTLTLLRGSVHVKYDDIVRLEGDRNYTRFILADGRKILTSRNISFYESLLPEYFVRVHKRHLLNRRYMIEKRKGYVRMSDGVEVEVARRKRGVVNIHDL